MLCFALCTDSCVFHVFGLRSHPLENVEEGMKLSSQVNPINPRQIKSKTRICQLFKAFKYACFVQHDQCLLMELRIK